MNKQQTRTRSTFHKHPASFTITKDLRGREVIHAEKYGIQDVYNGFSWVMGNLIAWGAIGGIAYLVIRQQLGL